jgi:hypothetical protein
MSKKVVEKRISVSLPPGWEAEINKLAELHHRSQHGELIHAIGQYIESEKLNMSKSTNRPCVISVGLPHGSSESLKADFQFLRGIFKYVSGDPRKSEINVICASPKDLSYEEAFIICQKRLFEVGWVYADTVGRREHDGHSPFISQSSES